MSHDEAERIALLALGWMAEDPERIGAFLGASGLAPGDVAQAAGDPGFLVAVLTFLTMEDESVIAFAAAHDLPPEAPLMALRALPGGEETHWT